MLIDFVFEWASDGNDGLGLPDVDLHPDADS